ncbi:MAG: ribosome-associated translation inhibitor RaiA [Candidatus Paceibacterota bacterium]|jgi:ribosomal subunit interface protein
MKISIKQTNIEVTPALSEYIDKKIGSLAKLLKKAEDKSEVLLYLEIARNTKHHHSGNVFSADAKLVLPKKTLYASHPDSDIRTAIDILEKKLQQEIKKYKDKYLTKHV